MTAMADTRRGLTGVTLTLTLIGTALLGGAFPTTAQAEPKLTVSEVVGNLRIPWDLTWVGGVMLYDQRAGGIWSKQGSASPQRVDLDLPRVYDESESGMLGMVADPAAATNKFFYTCIAVAKANGDPKGVEVWKWRLDSPTKATKIKTLISGIPLKSGRHSGCRLRFRSASALYVGTGDAAVGTNPQSLNSLGGKVLRIRSDGSIPKGNPFYKRGGKARYIWTRGHRNVQGLMFYPARKEIWSVEHGTSRDDEINRIFEGDNYGWAPTPGYNESRPMTDKRRFPNAHGPKWKSGSSTVATSGATFLTGSRWETWNGRLAVAMLKGEGVKLFAVGSNTRLSGARSILTDYGRIRTVQQGPDGLLYFTTSNASRTGARIDKIYKVTPS